MMKIHCHPELGDCSPDSGGSWIRPGKAARTTDTVQTRDGSQAMSATLNTPLTSRNYTAAHTALGYLTQRVRDEVDNENCVSSSVSIDILSNHDANLDSTRPRTETAITAHLFEVPPHPTSFLGSPAPSDSKKETIAEIRDTEDTPTLSPPASPQTNKLNALWPLLCSSEQSTSQFDANGKELHPLPSPIPAVVDLPPAIHLDAETSTSECSTPPMVDGVTNPNNIWNGDVKLLQQHTTSSSTVDNDIPTTSLTADDQFPFVQTGHADLGDVIEDSQAPMQDECDIQKEEQMNACIQEPETLTTPSIAESESRPRLVGNDNDDKRLEKTSGFPFIDEILDPMMSKVQDSSAGQLNKNPPIADPGGMNLGVPASSTTLPESPALKVTNHLTSFDRTSRLNSQSKSDTPALSAATTPSALTAFRSGRKITGSDIEADSAQGGLDYISIDCQAGCEITTSNIAADSGQGGTQTMQDGASCSNTTDGVSPTLRKTENRDCRSAAFGRVSQTITTSNDYEQGSALASKDALDRRGVTPVILKTNVPTTFIPTPKVTLVGQSEQDDLSVLSVTSGSSTLVASPQTADDIRFPILPPLPRSYADFGDVLHLLSPDKGDIRAEKTPVSTKPLEPRCAHTEIVISPTRTLFPSVSQDFEMTEQVIMPQNDITRARAASLRFHNKRLEDECDEWRQKHDELERKHRELENKRKDLEKNLANLGVEWLLPRR
ncbi:hypothetical protein PILCRDRAFT_565027 [Piloderma croceum F 1598]|uniref:Uncharacterized protein n=1 Tax=Piloderma croceum (strain F 1598) TaxID=765440 RepID=A0A0C3F3J5_PILCF|nr:hypothetical protein PILCRDRAFT_565027 [Piloderma croceum F 1598]